MDRKDNMTKYLVVDADQYNDSGARWAYEIEATSAEEAAEEAMEKAFRDWGWEAEWHRGAPDWVVCEHTKTGQEIVHRFTSEMEYEPVFYVRPKPEEKDMTESVEEKARRALKDAEERSLS